MIIDEILRYIFVCVSYKHNNDISPYITESACEKENLLFEGAVEFLQKLDKEKQELEAQIEQLQKINSEQKETLKKVRIALIQERTANIVNYGKGGVEMFDDMLEVLKGVSN